MFYFFNVFLGTATEAFPHMDELSMSIDPEQAARALRGAEPTSMCPKKNSSTPEFACAFTLVIVTIYFCRNTEAECCGEMNAETRCH